MPQLPVHGKTFDIEAANVAEVETIHGIAYQHSELKPREWEQDRVAVQELRSCRIVGVGS